MTLTKEKLTEYTPFILFAIALLVFIILKIPHIGLPFFWDESGVYGKIIFQLADNKLSLHPSAIDQWDSRGHPLLYPNLIAIACKIFGESVTVAHAANFLIACGLVISMFLHVGRAFHYWAGLVAGVALMSMPLFFTQSVFALPEVALAFTLWWSSWAFIRKKYVHYFLFGSAAMMIKEPAIVWIACLFGWSVLFERIAIWKKLLWLTPLIPFGIFLLVQKQTFGWYLFPFHTGSFDFTTSVMLTKFSNFMKYLFWDQARIIWLIFILIGGVLYWRQNKTHNRNDVARIGYGAVLLAAFIFILFSSTIFYQERYIIPSIMIVCSVLGVLTYKGLTQKNPLLAIPILIVLIASPIPFMSSNKFVYDNDMSYIRSIEVSKKTIKYMLERGMLNDGEFSATMPVVYVTPDPRFGYLPKDTLGRHHRIVHAGTKYVVQTIPGTMIENPDQFPLDTIVKWQDGDIRTIIYKVAPKDSIE